MLSRDDNEALCTVDRGTPMGSLLRRYWYPIAMSAEVAEPGGDPKPIRLLGEDLVLFRGPDGQLGLIDQYCPHRCASLVLARNEDCGLRCLYHGWLIDRDGQVLDMPNEPEASRLKERIVSPAFASTRWGEWCGRTWVSREMPRRRRPSSGRRWTPDRSSSSG